LNDEPDNGWQPDLEAQIRQAANDFSVDTLNDFVATYARCAAHVPNTQSLVMTFRMTFRSHQTEGSRPLHYLLILRRSASEPEGDSVIDKDRNIQLSLILPRRLVTVDIHQAAGNVEAMTSWVQYTFESSMIGEEALHGTAITTLRALEAEVGDFTDKVASAKSWVNGRSLARALATAAAPAVDSLAALLDSKRVLVDVSVKNTLSIEASRLLRGEAAILLPRHPTSKTYTNLGREAVSAQDSSPDSSAELEQPTSDTDATSYATTAEDLEEPVSNSQGFMAAKPNETGAFAHIDHSTRSKEASSSVVVSDDHITPIMSPSAFSNGLESDAVERVDEPDKVEDTASGGAMSTGHILKPRKRGVVVALGSNMGDRVAEIERACREIDADPDMRIVDTSYLYETDAMYVEDQDRFVNGACEVSRAVAPRVSLGLY